MNEIAHKILSRIFQSYENRTINKPEFQCRIIEFEQYWNKGTNPAYFEIYLEKHYPEFANYSWL